MKHKATGLIVILLVIVLAGCMVDHSEPAVSDADASRTAEERFTGVFQSVMNGQITGDTSPLISYLGAEDTDGAIREVLAENGLDPYASRRRASAASFEPELGLPDFTSATFEDGDILLSRDYTNYVSNFLAWLIQAEYTHSGVLDQEKAVAGDPSAPCAVSATLASDVSGVTYETWQDWNTNTNVAQMRLADSFDPDLMNEAQDNMIGMYGGANSTYEFIYFDDTYGIVPVSSHPGEPLVTETSLYNPNWPPNADLPPEMEHLRYDNYRWYCSKVTWWIYKSLGYDIENNALIHYKNPKNSGFYVLYKTILDILGVPDSHHLTLYFLYFTADMVVWPDEIRWALADLPAPLTGPLTMLNVWSWPQAPGL